VVEDEASNQDTSRPEAPIKNGTLRKYLRITIHNKGRERAENCDAVLTLIKHNSTSILQPSQERKRLVWDTGENHRTIGARKGTAFLDITFSQDSFSISQRDPNKPEVPQNEKIYAKVSTMNSLNNLDVSNIFFAEDGIGIGTTYFKLLVKTITGESTEAVLKITVTDNWHDLNMAIV